jgi:hypothetical protein
MVASRRGFFIGCDSRRFAEAMDAGMPGTMIRTPPARGSAVAVRRGWITNGISRPTLGAGLGCSGDHDRTSGICRISSSRQRMLHKIWRCIWRIASPQPEASFGSRHNSCDHLRPQYTHWGHGRGESASHDGVTPQKLLAVQITSRFGIGWESVRFWGVARTRGPITSSYCTQQESNLQPSDS